MKAEREGEERECRNLDWNFISVTQSPPQSFCVYVSVTSNLVVVTIQGERITSLSMSIALIIIIIKKNNCCFLKLI